jgi:hypothetical protein
MRCNHVRYWGKPTNRTWPHGTVKKDKFWKESKYENIISNFISVPTFGMTSYVMSEAFAKF